jgi:hypothetical protein
MTLLRCGCFHCTSWWLPRKRLRPRKQREPSWSPTLLLSRGRPPRRKQTRSSTRRRRFLPRKEGKPDQELYASFPEKSLRRRLWDAVVAGKCPRCSGPHLRIACPKPRQGWEDDFEKEDFFTKSPPPSKQVRVQLAGRRPAELAGAADPLRAHSAGEVPHRLLFCRLRRETRRPNRRASVRHGDCCWPFGGRNFPQRGRHVAMEGQRRRLCHYDS